MAQHIGIGIGAGLVSALLFGVLLKATPLAILLYLVAPLPILIVGLGWSHKAALAAAATGSLVLVLVIAPFMGLAFGAYIALPAWWLAYLTLLGRETPAGLEWYPTGRLLGWIAATAALAFIAIAVLSSPNHAAFDAQLRGLAQTLVQTRMPATRPDAGRTRRSRGGRLPGDRAGAEGRAGLGRRGRHAHRDGRCPGAGRTGLRGQRSGAASDLLPLGLGPDREDLRPPAPALARSSVDRHAAHDAGDPGGRDPDVLRPRLCRRVRGGAGRRLQRRLRAPGPRRLPRPLPRSARGVG